MKNLAVSLGALILLLLLLEIGVRTVGYVGSEERDGREYHPQLGHIAEGGWPLQEQPADSSILRLTHRMVDKRRAANTPRVLFIGDSGTAGSGVEPPETFSARFEAIVRGQGFSVESANAGAAGLTTVGEYWLYQSRLSTLETDAVVIGLFMANDIQISLVDAAWTHPGHSLDRMLQQFREISALADFLYLRTAALTAKTRGPLRVADLEDGELPSAFSLIDPHGISYAMYDPAEATLYLRRGSDLRELAYRNMETYLSRFAALAEKRGVKLAVVLIHPLSPILKHLAFSTTGLAETLSEYYGWKMDDLDFDAPRTRILEICERLKLTCLDPIRHMRAVGEPVIITDDDHPSPLGHEIIAQVLASHFDPQSRRFDRLPVTGTPDASCSETIPCDEPLECIDSVCVYGQRWLQASAPR